MTEKNGDNAEKHPPAAYRLIAAAYRSFDGFRRLLDSEPALMTERTVSGETPLHYLAVENHVEAMRLLVERGADVNTVDDCGETPLSAAASLGYEEVVRFLLRAGAKLRLEGQGEPTLHCGVQGGNLAVVRQLLDAGAPVNEINDLQATPLHLAAESDDRLEILRLLLQRGADATLERIFGETALDVAVDTGSHLCAAELSSR